MELIKISDQKIKIMLSPSDMTRYELDTEHLGDDSEQMHKAFRLLMQEIRNQTDFEFDDRRISVQYFPSREGGCEMFVSSTLPCSKNQDSKKPSAARSGTSLTPHSRGQHPCGFLRESAHRFPTLQALLQACARLRAIGFVGESQAYTDDRNHYILYLRTRSPSPFSMPEELEFLNEYSSMENPTLLRIYLKEHGKIICAANAVAILSKLK